MKRQVSGYGQVLARDTHQSRRQRPPDIETQSVRDMADLRSVRRKLVVAGVINEYHHAA
jgi:putative transposase